jgi:hypothetical protein
MIYVAKCDPSRLFGGTGFKTEIYSVDLMSSIAKLNNSNIIGVVWDGNPSDIVSQIGRMGLRTNVLNDYPTLAKNDIVYLVDSIYNNGNGLEIDIRGNV